MASFLTDVDASVTAALLGVVMLAGWGIGFWRGSRRAAQKLPVAPGKFNEAIMALLGLLLAFTFSLSLAKHDQRRAMVVADSNAIGDFYTCTAFAKGKVRDDLQTAVRNYLTHRLALVKERLDDAALQQRLDEIQTMQNNIQSLVEKAVADGTPAAVPLINTFNGVTSSHAARLAAARDRLPWSIVLLLGLAAIAAMFLVGFQQGAAGERCIGTAIVFSGLVCLVLWVTLDLNQPQQGLIKVSNEPLERLLKGMEPRD